MTRPAAFFIQLIGLVFLIGCATTRPEVKEIEFVKGKVLIGMTIDETKRVWGNCDIICKTCDSNGCFLQLGYNTYPVYGYLYFQNNNPNTPDFGYHLVSWSE